MRGFASGYRSRVADSRLQCFKLLSGVAPFVVVIERITAGRQSVAWRGSAITECAADKFVFQLAPSQPVPENFRVTQAHPPQADAIHPTFAQRPLRHVREEILEVGVSTSYKD